MKTKLIALFMMLLSVNLLSCEEESDPSFVVGQIQVGQELEYIKGYLSKSSDGDFYGECSYKKGKFSFIAGHTNPSGLQPVQPIYLSFSGIVGPEDDGKPVDGVFLEGRPKFDVNLRSSFSTGNAKAFNTESLSLSGTDDQCYVNLFATPSLTPDGKQEVISQALFDEDTGIEIDNKPFEFYVDIICQKSTSDGALTSVSAKLYFDNC